MIQEHGSISVHSENIFPIIKKWLYSDKDIFIRELVSNSCDAVSKLKRLSSMGEADVEPGTAYSVRVTVDEENKTIQVWDNGIGMTAEEVKKYINQVAFSGAEDFLAKYKEYKEEGSQIIGHFGLGFYSAFMVANKVQIDTLSYQEGTEAVQWTCTGGSEYEMEPSDRLERGTTVTLYIGEDSEEFLKEYRLREILMKYCSFLPVEIYLESAGEKSQEKEEEEVSEPKPLNDTHPLWLKNPGECTEEEYKEFYQKVFHQFEDPLFWIHLNVDYPFNLKGILYFPKLKNELQGMEGQIKLYSNQVFVADNIKEVIPEFLMLLKGAIDCPELPLNVSRSFLQNDGYVAKISSHISKKVADKLTGLFKTEREAYNKYWDDINPFIKYGCMRDDKFYEKVKEALLYKTLHGEYLTLEDYLEKNKDKHEKQVFYVTDPKQQAQYINLFKENDLDAILLTSSIDTHFVQFLEMKESGITFNRIDSDLSQSLKEEYGEEESRQVEELEKVFKDVLKNDKLKVKVESLKMDGVPAIILLSEQSRRMQEMSAYFGGMGGADMFPSEQTLVLNKRNELIQSILALKEREDRREDVTLICEQVYDLAMMSHRQLEPEQMTRFIQRSNEILARLTQVESAS